MTPPQTDPKDAAKTLPAIAQVINALRETWYSRRSVVPIVGAAISLDSGIPIITSVVRYFGKLHQYIENRAYLRCAKGRYMGVDPLVVRNEEYKEQPWKFIEDFGWPDRFQLNQDLLKVLENGDSDDKTVEAAVRTGLDSVLGKLNQRGNDRYDEIRKDLLEGLLDIKNHVAAANVPYNAAGRLKVNVLEAIASHENKSLVQNVLIKLREQVEHRLRRRHSNSTAFDLVGDWKKLIQHFTNYQGDYADALFSRFCSGRGPSDSHRYLAFLVKLLGIKTVFTFNFDELIERSLEGEGIHPRVFAMEHGVGLPHAALVRDAVSVVKLHGNNHALLVDERLDHPLSKEYKSRFNNLVKENPLLLVIGCSGDDHRLQDLIRFVLRDSSEPSKPRVLWLHFEAKPPAFLSDDIQKGTVLPCMTNHPGASLAHCYQALTNRHPASAVPYLVHHERPLLLGKEPKWIQQLTHEDCRVAILSTLDGADEDSYPRHIASRALIDLSNYWVRDGYHTIWIELEREYTLAGVVGCIIDQCRRFDVSLAPCVLPVDDKGVPEVALRRVEHALRRTRYFVAFEGLETYLWPPTTHHGETNRSTQRGTDRLNNLKDFLIRLVDGRLNLGETRIALSIDSPKRRSDDEDKRRVELFCGIIEDIKKAALHQGVVDYKEGATKTVKYCQVFDETTISSDNRTSYPLPTLKIAIVDAFNKWIKAPPHNATGPRNSACWACILLTLSTFRRTRSLAVLRRMLKPLLGSAENIDAVLAALSDDDTPSVDVAPFGLIALEGGAYWFSRPVRNYLYGRASNYVLTKHMRDLLTPPEPSAADPKAVENTVTQLVLQATMHQRISRTYYMQNYLLSRDNSSFLEACYHRISSIRTLTKLLALFDVAKSKPQYEESILSGIRKAGQFLEEAAISPKGFIYLLDRMELHPAYPALRGLLSGDSASFGDIHAAITARHSLELRGFYRGWVRAEPVLRSYLPAEHLLTWLETLRDDDLEYRCDRVIVKDRSDEMQKPETCPDVRAGGIGSLVASQTLSRFKMFLDDLRAKLWIERSDYIRGIGYRAKMLEGIVSDAVIAALAKGDLTGLGVITIPESGIGIHHVHYFLDIAVCAIKINQEKAQPLDLIDVFLDNLDKALSGHPLRTKIEELDSDRDRDGASFVSDYHEARLRILHLRAEVKLLDVSVFARGFAGAELPTGVALDEAQKFIDLGIARIRYQDFRGPGIMHSVLIDPAPDGSFFLQFRSIFELLQGKVQWLKSVQLWLDDKPKQWDRYELSDRVFESAFRHFEQARAGLGASNRLLAALIEIYAVESYLACARVGLHPDYNGASDDVMDYAFAKYESARGALQRANENLVASRRNVIWWKLYYSMVAQYHADRLLYGVCRLLGKNAQSGRNAQQENNEGGRTSQQENKEDGRTVQRELPQFLSRLRRGYSSLRSALDYRLPESGTGKPPVPSAWLMRTWAEMTLVTYVLGRFALAKYSQSREGKDRVKYDTLIVKLNEKDLVQYRSLNESEYVWNLLTGINDSERLIQVSTGGTIGGDLGPWFAQMEGWKERVVHLQAINAGQNLTLAEALNMRLEVIKHAAGFAESVTLQSSP
jgi:hypothetical protein